jgi:hypothetical protein
MLASQVSTFARGDATFSPQSTARGRTVVRATIEAKESRIGKQPVAVPKGVTYTLKDNHLAVKVRATRCDARDGERARENAFDRHARFGDPYRGRGGGTRATMTRKCATRA